MNASSTAWLYLLLAGVLEVGWAVAMKYSQGFTRLAPTVATFGMGFASFYFLSLAVKQLPIGTAYAVWVGVGAVGAALAGMALFGEPRHWERLASIVLVIIGIAGLWRFSAP